MSLPTGTLSRPELDRQIAAQLPRAYLTAFFNLMEGAKSLDELAIVLYLASSDPNLAPVLWETLDRGADCVCPEAELPAPRSPLQSE